MLVAALLAACGRGLDSPNIEQASAIESPLFVNGGFETGTFSSWTKTTYLNTTGLSAVPPTSEAQLQLSAGGKDFTIARTFGTPESQTPGCLVAGTGVPMWPRLNLTSAAINECAGTNPSGDSFHQGANSNVNTLKQSMATTSADIDPADGKVHVRFLLAPILEAAGHPPAQQPYFFVMVRNMTAPRIGTLYTNFNFANQAGVPWSSQGAGLTAKLFTSWQIFDVVPPDDKFLVGDTLEVEVYASGCEPGGHSGSAYVDGFGAQLPSLMISKIAPVRANVDTDITYDFTVKNNTSGIASNVVADEVTPPFTTFVSLSAPTATSCTTPAVGSAGTISCTYGWMNPGASENFRVTLRAFPASAQGAVTASTTTTVTDSVAAFGANAFIGYTVYIVSGPQAGAQSVISSNTATVLTVSPAFATAPAAGSNYKIIAPPTFGPSAISGATAREITKSGAASWVDNQWLGWRVAIVSGPGAGQQKDILTNSTSIITTQTTGPSATGTAWSPIPDTTSTFVIYKPVSDIVNGNYGVAGTSVSRLLGPRRETLIGPNIVLTDLSVTKTNGVPAVLWGGSTTYTVTVTNNGPNAVSGATVVDTMPSGLTGATWTCNATGGGVCAPTGAGNINRTVVLPVAAQAIYTITAGIIAGTGTGSLSNVAIVTAPSGVTDTYPDNNSAADTDVIAGSMQSLTVNKDPSNTGTGTVTSAPSLISCGPGCSTASGSFAGGSTVTLTAAASANHIFLGWTGACSGTATTCSVTMSAARTVGVLFTTCGNGVRDPGEGCDDGVNGVVANGDGCNTTCQIETTNLCATGPTGPTGNGSCASGVCDLLGNAPPGRCEAAGACGNGAREAGEACDDGNVVALDGCNAVCKLENAQPCNATAPGLTGPTGCASGVCDAVGNAAPGVCEAAGGCGNGTRDATEACDDGNTVALDGCNATCKIENAQPCNISVPGLTGSTGCASGVCDSTTSNPTPGLCEPAATCGNGTREASEGCDDGNTTSLDGCSATCLIESTRPCNAGVPGFTGNTSCASGRCDTVGNVAPGVCENLLTCGNGLRETNEGCDDGNTTNSDGCSAVCLIENTVACNSVGPPGLTGNASCSSGVCDVLGQAAPGRCEASNTCGNGVREAGEGCDDGNVVALDGCSATCLVENGSFCNASAPGLTNSNSCQSGLCDLVGNAAPGRCEAAGACGNGVRETGEGCDDGNTSNADACSSGCLVQNGNPCNANGPGLTGSGSCVSGVCDAVGNAAPGVCEAAGGCGNGTRDATEACDDGNTVALDGCNATCKLENTRPCNASVPGLTGPTGCASGVCDTVGNPAPGVCEGTGVCGNGQREAGEGCDDGNIISLDGCGATCLIESTRPCNAGVPGLTGNASCTTGRCDTVGNAAPGVCETLLTCGNGLRETNEGCDDGNTANSDGCSAVCLIENTVACNSVGPPGLTGSASCSSGVCDVLGQAAPGRCEASNTCGNGVREAGEGCDDGNVVALDGCNATCLVENGSFCNASAPGFTNSNSCQSGLCDLVGNAAPGRCEAAGACGNGVRETGEGCDDGNTSNADACSSGCLVQNGNPCNASGPGLTGSGSCVSGVCDAVGNAAPGVCEAAGGCGNGTREAGEACDDGNIVALDGCNGACKLETSQPCNALVPGLTGPTGCASGVCDTVGNPAPGVCEGTGVCGNGQREAGEGCDDGNTISLDGCGATCLIESTRPCNVGVPGLTGNASCTTGRCDTVGNSAPGVCETLLTCGNGLREANEGCDDGNTANSDGCSAVCLIENTVACNSVGPPGLTGSASCSSGVCDVVGQAAPGRCEASNACGNGVREVGEGCDDGNVVSSDGCSATCLAENGAPCNASAPGFTGGNSCVSGVCDSVGNASPGVCEAAGACGNGVRESGEGCDDGNLTSSDGCSATCKVESGNPCNASTPGLTGSGSCVSGVCDTVGQAAPGVCEAPNVCGNGAREAGEGCDDGNTTANDGCSALCLVETGAPCNANSPGFTGASSCVSGQCDTVGNLAPGVCENTNACGNGLREAGEGCDDGNLNTLDGCDASCRIEMGRPCNNMAPGVTGNTSCASGICDTVGQAAPGVCEASNSCGNGVREASEGCDDGNTTNGDGCNGLCGIEVGNPCNTASPGLVNAASCASGICDTTGNAAPGVCEATNACGNGVREAGEGCDDGNVAASDGCSATCLVENTGPCNASAPGLVGNASCSSGVCDTTGNAAPGVCEALGGCGNGVRESGEGCDDGNANAGDGCSATCLIENGGDCGAGAPGLTSNASCSGGVCNTVGFSAPGKCDSSGVCGNGVREAGEGCDDGNMSAGDGCNASCRVENGRNCNASSPGVTGGASCLSEICDITAGAPGICRGDKPLKDSDKDGVNDDDDLDDDNDGIPDALEDGPDTDTDGDGVPDRLDLDTDNDGVLDAWEAGHTQDILPTGVLSCTGAFGVNGLCDAIETSADSGRASYRGDGSETLAPRDTDGDGIADFRDLDADGDGILDAAEGGSNCADTDANGICDGTDSDGDGVVTVVVLPVDTDGDKVPDFRDLDSDNDGITDLVEGGSSCADIDSDAVCDGTDDDKDGIKDSADKEGTKRGTSEAPLPPDTDGDSIPDFRDLDSDNDGFLDRVEGKSPCTDTDRDGVCDAGDTDGDGLVDTADGKPDVYGSGPERKAPVPDTDGDGLPDYRDLDSDGDGTPDIVKAGLGRFDANGDGRIDSKADGDGDGIADIADPSETFGGAMRAAQRLIGGGCNCSATQAPVSDQLFDALPFLLAFVVLVVRKKKLRRTQIRMAAATVAFWGVGHTKAQAQTSSAIDVQLFKPGVGKHDILNVLSTQTCGTACAYTGVWLHYALNPLVLIDDRNQRVARLVDNRLTADFVHSWGVTDFFDIGLHMPVHIQSSNASDLVNPKFVGQGWVVGAGDLRLIPRARFWQNDMFSVGLALPIIIPTGRTDAFMGGGFIGIEPRLLGGFKWRALRVDANAGVNLRRLETLANVTFGNEFAWSLGGEYDFNLTKTGSMKLAVLASIHGLVGLVGDTTTANRSVELDLGARFMPNRSINVGLMVGRGLLAGYGSPDLRVAANVGFSFECITPPPPLDTDGDHILDINDQCPLLREDYDAYEDFDGCPDPDNDGDTVVDTLDQCPFDLETINGFEDLDGCPELDTDGDGLADSVDQCPKEPETKNGFKDEDGCPDVLDTDGDGLLDDVDSCPNDPEDKDGFEDKDGCPEPDNDRDGILDANDKCPDKPETINGVNDEDGCPDQGATQVKIEGNKIVILDKVYFATGKAEILDRSFSLLAQVASTLNAHPELKKVRIEGHTDDQGDDDKNLDLSDRRAMSVRMFLIERGIDPGRLIAIGYGETHPVTPNTNSRGREMNRRVEFVVIDTN